MRYRSRAIRSDLRRLFANLLCSLDVNRGRQNESRNYPLVAAWILWAGVALTLGGCTGAGVHRTAADSIDLIERLMPVDAGAHSKNINRHLSVIRKGVRKDAVALVAPISVRAPLQGVSGKRVLEGWATPVFDIGDGIQMDVFIARSGDRRLIGRRYFDAGRRFEDRAWIPISFPVEIEEKDQLEITVSAGPQGDLVADWLALSDLRLAQRNAGL